MVFWANVRRALNPTLVCRRYRVSLSGYCGGYFECFWTLNRARAFYHQKTRANAAVFITLEDEWTYTRNKFGSRNPKLIAHYHDESVAMASWTFWKDGVTRTIFKLGTRYPRDERGSLMELQSSEHRG